ncbi:MAG: hypothetical protein QOG63_10 [Thermoleophilaceae bacterium]|nr:hypothetical protein [Thermoleophilaceae bacterium]
MRIFAVAALLIGVLLIPTAIGLAQVDHNRRVAELDRRLTSELTDHASKLENYFARARSVILLTANTPAFAQLLAEPGSRARKIRGGRSIREVTHQLHYLERLYPESIGEACLVDRHGNEFARVVRGAVAPPTELSTKEERTPFFAPTFALAFGQTYQPRPYVSPDTNEWVVANATLIPQQDGHKRAFVHFEVTVESFRRALGQTRPADLLVIDGSTGRVVIDGDHAQRIGAPLGTPDDSRFAALTRHAGAKGVTQLAGHEVAYRRIQSKVGNANDWIVVSRAKEPLPGVVAGMGPATIVTLATALLLIMLSGVFLRAGRRELESHAATDALTGLGNRRSLLAELERRVKSATAGEPAALTLFDLNGFKNYNDTFGHPAGDALLCRLADALAAAVAPFGGRAYRPGGDEFCVISDGLSMEALEHAACLGLSEQGEGFAVSTAVGSVLIPRDTSDAADAVRIADTAMYQDKHSGRVNADRQSSDVLLSALAERHPDLGDHLHGVTELAVEVGKRIGVQGSHLGQLGHAARLHDIGKVALPDGIVNKPGPLDASEWAFMRTHTLVGERIIAAAPALAEAARLVRASHEAWDGSGYPDRLTGAEIPLGARVISICDAFDAMISDRPYASPKSVDEAVAEIRRCAGTQFDPAIVPVFAQVMAERARPPVPAAGTS